MPQNSSAWVDIRIHLIIVVGLLLVIMLYNRYVAIIGFVLFFSLFIYGRERCRDRQRELEEYYRNVVKNINELTNYAIDRLPVAILVVDSAGRMKWCNQELVRWLGEKPEIGTGVKSFWEKFVVEPIWGKDGSYVFSSGDKFYEARHRQVFTVDGDGLMAFYVTDVTEAEKLKRDYALEKTVISYIQIDNYDEVLQGLNEAQRTAIVVEVNRLLDEWVKGVGAFLRRTSEDLYIAVMNRNSLNQAMSDKFDILDKVRAVHGANNYPVTLSLGVAAATGGASMTELGEQAQAGLDLALGRGGDQVAVQIDGKTQFYGGKAKAVEKHTRVKARVVAHALNEIIDNSDLVLIMGHHNEDFDSLGSAMGVARMARHLGKEAHIVLSEMNEGIDKFTELIKNDPLYEKTFISAKDVGAITALNPALFVVDTHIPYLTAAPQLLERIERVIVIDHHRRSENFINNPFLVYIEPASSSTSELVTELIMYFSENLAMTKMDATSLYAGMVVDTKNFAVQTGVRTFEAAGYLRRAGADPVMVRHLFRTDYETGVAKARAFASSEFLEGGLIVAVCPPHVANAQIIAAQVADGMLRIEDARMSLVLFHIENGGVGISARSTGEINVQVIMEEFGGGGHQNVAGAQVKNADIEEIKRRAVELSMNYMRESDKSESHIAARSEKVR